MFNMRLVNFTRLAFAFSLSLSMSFGLLAQLPTIYINSDTVEAGQDIEVPVFMDNSEGAIGYNFTMTFDSLDLTYLGFRNGIEDGEIRDVSVDTGLIGYLKFNFSLAELNYPDSTELVTFLFSPKRTGEFVTQFGFYNPSRLEGPLDTIVFNVIGEPIPAKWIGGTYVFQEATSLPTISETASLRVYPNPLAEESRIEIKLDYASESTLEILDLSGRLLRTQKVDIRPGTQHIPLDINDFTASGTYLIRLSTDREIISRKIIRR